MPEASAAQFTSAPPSTITLVTSRAASRLQIACKSGRPSSPAAATCSTLIPCSRSCCLFFSSANEQKTSTSSFAVCATRESSGSRRCESTIKRRRGRLRGSPLLSVSRGLSAITVPTPTKIASCWCRKCWTCVRASSLVIHPPVGPPVGPPESETWVGPNSAGGGAIFPSRVIPAFSVTNGVLYRMYFANASFSGRASSSSSPDAT